MADIEVSLLREINFSNFQLSIDVGSEGTYDTSRAYMPSVIKDGDTYKIWYSGYSGGVFRTIYATSVNGTTWTNFQMVVDKGSEGTYDTTHAYMPCVIKDGSTYKMWYTGYNGSNYRVIYATSTNGTTWTNFQMVVNIGSEGTYDTTHAYSPAVIKDGDTYKMWYTGYDGSNYRLIYATSSNGTTWTNHQMVINIGSEGTYDTTRAYLASVIKDDEVYKIWYTGDTGTNQRIIYAKSTNGTTWTNFQLAVDIGAEGTYDTTHTYSPAVIKDGDTYKIWYSAYNGTSNRIVYADTASSIIDSLESSLQTNIYIELSNNLFTSTSSINVSEIYAGYLIYCPSSFNIQSSLSSNQSVEIYQTKFESINSLQSSLEVSVLNNIFTSTSLMSAGVEGGIFVYLDEHFSLQNNLIAIPEISVTALFQSTSSIQLQPELRIFTQLFTSTNSIISTIQEPFSVAVLPRVYMLTLIDSILDDIVIPIKSFQIRKSADSYNYLSVVIPGTDYAAAINDRIDGIMYLRMGYTSNNIITLSQVIAKALIDKINIYEGAINKSINLSGYDTEQYTLHQTLNLTNASYKNNDDGSLRYRCKPDMYLQAGDYVSVDGEDFFTVNEITHSVSAESETFEVSE